MTESYLKKCESCGEYFLSGSQSGKFCSNECKPGRSSRQMEKCSVDGCSNHVHCRGLCNKHYRKLDLAPRREKPCGCGCGEMTIYDYVWGHNTRLLSSEEQSRRGNMNTGDWKRDTGSADWYRKVRGRHEHRVVAEQMLGRPLAKGEIVHHKNHNKKDNRPENLEVMTQSEHVRIHNKEYWEKKRNG